MYCVVFGSVLFCSVPFNLSYSVPFILFHYIYPILYLIVIYSILFCSILFYQSTLLYSILFAILFYVVLFCSVFISCPSCPVLFYFPVLLSVLFYSTCTKTYIAYSYECQLHSNQYNHSDANTCCICCTSLSKIVFFKL